MLKADFLKYMKILSAEEGERKLVLELKDGWILKFCSKGLLFQCRKGIVDINQDRRGFDLAYSFESQWFQKEVLEHPDSQECHQR